MPVMCEDGFPAILLRRAQEKSTLGRVLDVEATVEAHSDDILLRVASMPAYQILADALQLVQATLQGNSVQDSIPRYIRSMR